MPGALGKILGGSTGGQPGGSTGSQPGGSSGSQPGGGTDSSTGSPIYLTDPHGVASQEGAAAQSGLNTLGQNVQSTEQALDTANTQISNQAEATGTGWLQYLGNEIADSIPRTEAGVLALIMIGLALWMLGHHEGEGRAA